MVDVVTELKATVMMRQRMKTLSPAGSPVERKRSSLLNKLFQTKTKGVDSTIIDLLPDPAESIISDDLDFSSIVRGDKSMSSYQVSRRILHVGAERASTFITSLQTSAPANRQGNSRVILPMPSRIFRRHMLEFFTLP